MIELNNNNGNISTGTEDNVNACLQATADTAEADKSNKAAAELGKFKSVDALLKAYEALEAEFTRRSTRLKELEEGNKAQGMPAAGAPSPKPLTEDKLIEQALASDDVKRAVISEYLKSLSEGKSVPLISGGVSPVAGRNAPKSVKEAGALAKQFLKI